MIPTHGKRPSGPRAQRGLTLITWLLIIAVAFVIGTAAMRLIPLYLENFKIVSSMNSVKAEFATESASIPAIRKALGARFDVESVRVVHVRDVEIKRQGKGFVVRAEYDHRTPFVGNIDFIVHFNTSVEIGT